jgi:hypothetical protein
MSSFVLRLLTRPFRKRCSPFAGAAGCRTSSDACRTPARGCGTECSGRSRASAVTCADTGPEVVSAPELSFISAIQYGTPTGTQRVIRTLASSGKPKGRKRVLRRHQPAAKTFSEQACPAIRSRPSLGRCTPSSVTTARTNQVSTRPRKRDPGCVGPSPKDGAPGPRTVFQPNGSSWVVRGVFYGRRKWLIARLSRLSAASWQPNC